MTSKIALVTGSNQGIGFWIAKKLALNSIKVIVAARDSTRGEAAVKELEAETKQSLDFVQLDISDHESVKNAAHAIQTKYGQIDILVNNAAIAINRDFSHELFKTTFAPNYFGTLDVIDNFLPLIKKNGVIVNVSSQAGALNILSSEDLKKQFSKEDITEQELKQLLSEYDAAILDGTYKEKGWPTTAYGASKLFLTAHSRALAHQDRLKSNGITIFACCPGWCKTNMAGFEKPPRTAEQGSEKAVELALGKVPNAISGHFYTSTN
ncbi:hypothetical protein PPL_04543 [Heterostelium album PN500]|uniref:Carbonyl reductase n=1 Tax=Heterostelium pallidum (strain ATCC 26659 / Pp 5 / PN500) TaxID=670386 RepID=D3B7V5_HETP5|nr:hypothetical protein PPL_04543 [Heterostelium album PN500]EFA82848.1 hypothetical protein PPL_04543 [Heterostelium album PN500]|eukprot:XP_020434965.1 hypothetical protein PPL_04543 [Heterostelium album PN500]